MIRSIIFAVAEEPQPDTALQVWTLCVAAVAAVASLLATVIVSIVGRRAASERDRTLWLRQEQTRAYEAFSSAGWAAWDEIAGGKVQKALDHPTYDGLDEAADAVESHTREIFAALRTILVVGGATVVASAASFADEWAKRAVWSVPLSGAAHRPAQEQRLDYVAYFSRSLFDLAEVMRTDLGLSSKTDHLTADVAKIPLPAPDFFDVRTGEANQFLRHWRVQRWAVDETPTPGPDYRTDSTPWAHLRVEHDVLAQPLAAVVRKVPGRAWEFAVDSSLTDHEVDLIERDAASLVRSAARGGSTKYGADAWVAGEGPGERLYWWTKDSLSVTVDR